MPETASLSRAARLAGVRVGRIVEITAAGKAMVDFPENDLGPLVARTVADVVGPDAAAKLIGAAVLLAFEDERGAKPIVLGLLNDAIAPPRTAKSAPGAARTRDITVEGRRLTFDAKDEIVLRCGKATIILRANGEVIVKGARLASRATGVHTLKGATVRIN